MVKRSLLWRTAALAGAAAVCGGNAHAAQNQNGATLPTLSRDFTLVYHVKQKDVRSKALRSFRIEWQKAVDNDMVQRGQRSEEEAARDIESVTAAFTAIEPVKEYTVTLSSRDGKLLYKCDGAAKATVLYVPQDNLTYSRSIGMTKAISTRVDIDPGFETAAMFPFLLPGANVPNLPAVISSEDITPAASGVQRVEGLSPINRGARASQPGIPSAHIPLERSLTTVVFGGGGSRIRSCSLRQNGTPVDTWQYANHVAFAGTWLPQTFEHIQSIGMRTKPWKAGHEIMVPETSYTGTLVSSSEDALPPAEFDPKMVMRTGDGINDNRTTRPVSYQYHAMGGSLDDQARRARWNQARFASVIQDGRGKSDKRSGLFLLGALSFAGLAGFVRYRGSRVGDIQVDDARNDSAD